MGKTIAVIGLVIALIAVGTSTVHARAIDNVDLWTNWNDAVYCSNTSGWWIFVTVQVTEYHAFSRNQSYVTTFWVAPYDDVFVGWTGYCGGDIEDVGYCLIRAAY